MEYHQVYHKVRNIFNGLHVIEINCQLASYLAIAGTIANDIYYNLGAVLPERYFNRGGNPIMSVNGSFEDGNCSLLATTCNEPTTSVLQDGITPTLTGLDGGES